MTRGDFTSGEQKEAAVRAHTCPARSWCVQMLQPHQLRLRSNSYTNLTCGLVTGTGFVMMLAEVSRRFFGWLFCFFGFFFTVSVNC